VPNWFGSATVVGWKGSPSELNPVLWSLQTEIELYILFPLSLVLFRLLPKRTYLVLMFTITLASWLGWLMLRQRFNYFPPLPSLCHWYIWNLGLYLCFTGVEKTSKTSSLALGLFGFASGAVLVLIRNKYHSNILSFWYFFTGVGAYYFLEWALVAVPKWLRHPVMGVIGKRSYSYYLNHWPVGIIGSLLFSSKLAAAAFILVVLAGLGEISYRFIELPFIRFGKSLAAHFDSAEMTLLRSEAKAPSSANI
jgi:peptidoglycan/LPS O-acetylase OafA/YrhL